MMNKPGSVSFEQDTNGSNKLRIKYFILL